jgi:hypothetical protein
MHFAMPVQCTPNIPFPGNGCSDEDQVCDPDQFICIPVRAVDGSNWAELPPWMGAPFRFPRDIADVRAGWRLGWV